MFLPCPAYLSNCNQQTQKGKSPDSNGIRAEDIKACDDETRETVRQIFNEIVKRNNFTPEDWKVTIRVIHKKGDVENVSNYRPIAHCLRCTNCSRRFCTEDYTQRPTRNERKIRLASENPTRQQTTLQRTE